MRARSTVVVGMRVGVSGGCGIRRVRVRVRMAVEITIMRMAVIARIGSVHREHRNVKRTMTANGTLMGRWYGDTRDAGKVSISLLGRHETEKVIPDTQKGFNEWRSNEAKDWVGRLKKRACRDMVQGQNIGVLGSLTLTAVLLGFLFTRATLWRNSEWRPESCCRDPEKSPSCPEKQLLRIDSAYGEVTERKPRYLTISCTAVDVAPETC